MAFEIPGFSYSLEASADLSAEQFTFMVADANGEAAQAGAGDDAVGVLQNDPAAQGEAANLQTFGISKVVAGAAVASGAQVMSDATGRAITATGTGAFVTGVALQAAANADEIIAVLVSPGGQLN